MAKKITKHRMDPTDYRNFLKQVELEAIVLDSCSVKSNRDNIGSNIKLEIKHSVSYKIENESAAMVTSGFDLVATKSTKKDFALKVSCVYQVMLSSKRPFTDEFMSIFTDINAQMNTWPYYREFVQSMVQRIGFPPLTLPLLKR